MASISIVLPVYNGENTIDRTIQSILGQTYSDFELLIIDDGSTDRTLAIVDRVKDKRVKVFSYANGGSSVARNRGIAKASGEFIAFIDADDLWTADKLQLQIRKLQCVPQAGLVYSWVSLIDEYGNFVRALEPVFYEGDVYRQMLVHNFITSGSNAMLRHSAVEAVGNFDAQLKSWGDDWDYWIRVSKLWPFAVVNSYQIFYRKFAATAVTANAKMMEQRTLFVMRKAFNNAPYELQHLKTACLAYIYQYIANVYLNYYSGYRNSITAGVYLCKSILSYPRIVRQKPFCSICAKWFLVLLLPPKWAACLLARLRQVDTQRNPLWRAQEK